MSELSSFRVPFRTLQAISDLRTIARSAGETTLARIAAGAKSPTATDDLVLLVGAETCRIIRPGALHLHQGLIVAAAMPEDDFEAFQTATAILIADRLQRGTGKDDLFWHWDAFHDHYKLADAPVRAAILQGFMRMEAEDLVALEDPPRGPAIATEKRADILTALEAVEHPSAAAILAALRGAPVHDGFWTRHCKPNLGLDPQDPIPRGIRHLVETRLDWDPQGSLRFDPVDETTPVLRVVPTD